VYMARGKLHRRKKLSRIKKKYIQDTINLGERYRISSPRGRHQRGSRTKKVVGPVEMYNGVGSPLKALPDRVLGYGLKKGAL